MEVPGATLSLDEAGDLEVTFKGERRCVAPDSLFAVVLVWSTDCTACTAWLTTTDGWSAPFSTRAFAEPELHAWLSRLPAWNPDALDHARRTCGLHLVWRCITR